MSYCATMADPSDTSRALTAAGLVADGVAEIAGPEARSVILHGSLAAGGFRAGHSDLDLLAVVDGGLTDAQCAALERLVRAAALGGATGLDLLVVTAAVAAAPTRAPALELQVGRHDHTPAGARSAGGESAGIGSAGGESAGIGSAGIGSAGLEVGRRVAADPDLPTELSMARAGGRALQGAAPRDVLAPVPAGWVVDRGRHWLLTWRTLTDDAENAVFMALTACRIWRFAVEHTYCSKAEAARWALDRDPGLAAVRRLVHDPAGAIPEQDLAGLLDTVLRQTVVSRGRRTSTGSRRPSGRSSW